MLRGETLSGVLGRGKRIFPTDGKRKRVRIAPKPCRNVRSEYRARRNGIKVSEIAFSPHKNGAEGETDREGDETKRRNGKNEGIRRQRAKNAGKPTCERLPASAEKKARARVDIIMVINPCKAVGKGADEACICKIKAMNGGSEAARRRDTKQRRACREILP